MDVTRRTRRGNGWGGDVSGLLPVSGKMATGEVGAEYAPPETQNGSRKNRSHHVTYKPWQLCDFVPLFFWEWFLFVTRSHILVVGSTPTLIVDAGFKYFLCLYLFTPTWGNDPT